MISITVSNNLTIHNCPSEVVAVAKKVLTLPNPAYHRIVKITGNSWAAQRDFKYYKTVGNTLIIPRGMRDRFIGYLDKNGYEYEIKEDLINEKSDIIPKFKDVILRDYQEKIVEDVIKKQEGVISASTGSGKTVIACWLTKYYKLKTTILVPNTIIQKQFKEEFKKWFNYNVGIINGEEKNIKDITISTFQSLSSNKELLSQLSNQTSLLITDECHVGISDGRVKILNEFKPKYFFGLSGSPRKSSDDGRTAAIMFYFGNIIAEYNITKITPIVEVIRTNVDIEISCNYAEMIDDMVNNKSRNTLISGLAVGEALSGKNVLILTKRREHCKKLMEKFEGLNAWYADSDDKDRNEILLKLRSGEMTCKIIVGTFSLLGQGTDIPSLEVLILAGDLKTDVGLEQAGGRILRLFEGKDSAKIYDLYDNRNGILRRQASERFKFYKSKGWEIKGLDYQKKV